jgi:hypothetical protein
MALRPAAFDWLVAGLCNGGPEFDSLVGWKELVNRIPQWHADGDRCAKSGITVGRVCAGRNPVAAPPCLMACKEPHMNNRYRAGQPADLGHMLHRYTQCPSADSGCNGPKEAECIGICRVDASQIKDGRAVVVPGKYESSPLPYTDITPAWHIKAWDFAGRVLDRVTSIPAAWKRLVRRIKTRHIPDPFN